MINGEDFFMGIEYASDGYKLSERKFNYKKAISYWTDINDLFKKITK
jgi:hypothetical protein